MKARAHAKSILVLIVIGTLVSAQQASAESVFTAKGFEAARVGTIPDIAPIGASAPASGSVGLGFRAFSTDSVETFDVEIEEEKGPGIIKQLAVFAIITAVVGYAVISLMSTDDEPAKVTKPAGKEIPTSAAAARISAAITR